MIMGFALTSFVCLFPRHTGGHCTNHHHEEGPRCHVLFPTYAADDHLEVWIVRLVADAVQRDGITTELFSLRIIEEALIEEGSV